MLILLAFLAALIPGVAFGFWLHDEATIDYQRGSPTIEFVTTLKTPEQKRPRKVVLRLPWPTYGLQGAADAHRDATSSSGRPSGCAGRSRRAMCSSSRPSSRTAASTSPSSGAASSPSTTERGRWSGSGASTAARRRRRRLRTDVVYHAWMQPLPVQSLPRAASAADDHRAGARGPGSSSGASMPAPFESHAAPHRQDALLRLLGPQALRDRHLHAASRAGRSPADDEINSSPAYAGGNDLLRHRRRQRLRGQRAARDACVWRARSFARFGRREYFYATPTIAYGRVFIGNTDGTLYAFGASSGRLLWAQRRRHLRLHGAAVWRGPGLRRHLRRVRSSPSTRRRATGSGASRRRRRSTARRASSTGSSTSPPARAAGSAGSRYAKQGPRRPSRWTRAPASACGAGPTASSPGRRRQQPPLRRRPLAALQLRAEAVGCPAQARSKHDSDEQTRSKARRGTSSGRRGRGRGGRRSRRQSPRRRPRAAASATASTEQPRRQRAARRAARAAGTGTSRSGRRARRA